MKSIKLLLLIIILQFISGISLSQTAFQKTYGALNSFGLDIQQTTDNGFIVLGKIDTISAGSSDIYLMKLDYKGDTLWTRIYGGVALERGNSILQTADGGYIFTGYTHSFGAGDADFIVVKTDASGNVMWNKNYGGAGFDYATKIEITFDGNFVIFGITASFGSGNRCSVLLKIDPLGNILWYKTYGELGYVYGSSWGEQTDDGGFILIGSVTKVATNDQNTCLIKTDSIGNIVWTKSYGEQDQDAASFGQQTADGGYILGRSTSSFSNGDNDIYLVKTDSIGNLLWSKTYGGTGTEYAISIHQTNDGGYSLFGWTQSFGISLTDYDMLLIKTDSLGDLQWSKIYGDTAADSPTVFGLTNDGYILGGISYSFGSEFYLVRTDLNGASGCHESDVFPIVTAPATQTVMYPLTEISFTPTVTSPVLTVNNGGAPNTLCTNVGIDEPVNNEEFQLYPNPSSGSFVISFEKQILNGKVEIYNQLGAVILTENIFNTSSMDFFIQNASKGIYFVKVLDGEMIYCKKVALE